MSGTPKGGRLAAETNKRLYGANFYSVIGAAGGRKSRNGGFRWLADKDPELLKELSSRGGSTSRRPRKEVGI